MEKKIDKSNNIINNGISDISLVDLCKAVWRRLWIVAISALLCAVLVLLATVLFITPKYQASAKFYVNNSSVSLGDTSFNITSGDISAAKSLVDTYIVILNTRNCLNRVIDHAEVDYTPSELRSMISAEAVNETEIFEVVVTSSDPEEAKRIADAIEEILPNQIDRIINGTQAVSVDDAVVPTAPSSPNKLANAVIGFIVGGVLSVVVIIIREMLDNTIRSEEDITANCSYPILASVPDMSVASKESSYYYGKDDRRKYIRAQSFVGDRIVIGDNITFAATEAYKLLRTKIQFSFADDKNCRILGISSALVGEGKSLTSINLAYSLAQLEKRVLIIDCDMRRPSITSKLRIKKDVGLSNYLTDKIAVKDIIVSYDKFKKAAFDVISAGVIPPNPVELLESEKMQTLLDALRENYDYIILDLTPVSDVTDAMVASRFIDGMILVTSQDYCNRGAFANAVNQFEFVDSHILGIVLNRVSEKGHGYAYKSSYHKKYYGYGYDKTANKQ